MNKKIKIALIILIIVIAGAGVVWFLSRSKQTTKLEEMGNQNESLINPITYELTPEELEELQAESSQIPVAGNKEDIRTFKVSSARGVYPKFISGYLEPAKPATGKEQTISIKIEDPSGLKKVDLEIKDENGQKLLEKVEMELAEGDAFKGDWTAVWRPHDFENAIRWVFTVENNDGKIDDLTYFTTTQ